MTRQKILDRARDELFSHINRCGVLQAAPEDQEQWMDETIEYLGERFPDLTDGDLRDLYAIGIRFCKPAIAHGEKAAVLATDDAPAAESVEQADETGTTQAVEVGDPVEAV